MAQVHLKNITKTYGSGSKAVAVIHGISIDIDDGEFVVMVGPSGCGKSTLLRMVAGLEEITGGDIVIGDRVVNNLEPKDRDIAMVFQNYALYPHMSVYENMAYGLKIRRFSKQDIEQRVQKAAGILELGALLQRTPRQLSGGDGLQPRHHAQQRGLATTGGAKDDDELAGFRLDADALEDLDCAIGFADVRDGQ